jgi:release factor glutamine methyltransferase
VEALVTRLRAAGCVFAEEEAALLLESASSPDDLETRVARRVEGVPLEHVLGWAGFHGLRVAVDSGVFVPRRRTEFLVDEALRRGRPGAVVLDLCCGTGAVGLAVHRGLRGTLYAADLDPAAVRCARRNLADDAAGVFEGDLFGALPASLINGVDLLLANVPYVPAGEIALLPPEARDHEARMALDGGSDGLDVLRRVAASAGDWLRPAGLLFTETSERQAPEAVSVLEGSGFQALIIGDDETTIVMARP